MSYTLEQTQAGSSITSHTSGTVSLTSTLSGSLIPLQITLPTGFSVLSVTDNVGNTYTLQQTVPSPIGTNPKHCYYYDCFPAISGVTLITATFSGSTNYAICCREYSGIVGGIDAQGTASGNNNHPQVLSTTTSTNAYELVLFWCSAGLPPALNVGSGYGNFTCLPGSGTAFQIDFEDKLSNTIGGFSGDVTSSFGTTWAWSAGIATYPAYFSASVIDLTAIGGVASGITLSWTSLSNVAYYTVYRFSPEYGGYLPITVVGGLAYFDSNVSLDIDYYYYIVATFIDTTLSLPSNVAYAMIISGGVLMAGRSRSVLYQTIQIGKESVAGTIVPATRRVLGWDLIPVPSINVKPVMSDGAKSATDIQLGYAYTTAKVTAPWNFNSVGILMAMAYGLPTPVPDTFGAYTYNWNPSATDPDLPQSYSIEAGSVAGAEKFGYAIAQDISFKWTDADASLDATIMGQYYTRDTVMTTDYFMTVSANAAMSAVSLSVTTTQTSGTIPNGTYITNAGHVFVVTGGGTITAGAATLTVTALAVAIALGEYSFTVPEIKTAAVDPVKIQPFISLDGSTWTGLLTVLDGSLNLGGLWKQVYHTNDLSSTYDGIVQANPKITASITCEEGTESDNYMSYLQNKQQVWLGIKATGPAAGTNGLLYTFKYYQPVYVTKPDPGNKNDILGNTWTFDGAHNLPYGLFNFTLINTLPTLT